MGDKKKQDLNEAEKKLISEITTNFTDSQSSKTEIIEMWDDEYKICQRTSKCG